MSHIARYLVFYLCLALSPLGGIPAADQTAVENYFDAVVEDCDYLNDWLTHMEELTAEYAEDFGFGYCAGEIPVYVVFLPMVSR